MQPRAAFTLTEATDQNEPAEAPRFCRHCEGRPEGPDDLQCPNDQSWYVIEESFPRHKLDPLLGTALEDKYPLLEVLGEGGFGTVYRAKQLAEGKALREVAVKTVRSTGAVDSEEATGRFRREAAAIASLNHPNIVQLYDFGVTEQGVFYMVLELVSGATLGDTFDGRELFTPERVARVFRQVLEGLACAHDAGMVHRDLKPDNIMLVQSKWANDQVKILDFGLAKLMGGSDAMKLSRTNTAYGTVHYMAPEQVVGGKVDARSDLYPVGVMLYQIYAGFRPFDAESAPIVMFQHVHRDVPELPESVPLGVRSFIYKALRKRPSERFSDASDMLAGLQHAMDHPGVEIPGGERPKGIPRPGPAGAPAADDDPYAAALAADPPGKAGSAPLVTPSTAYQTRGQIDAVVAPAGPAVATAPPASRASSDSSAIAAEMVSAPHPTPKASAWRKAVVAAVGIGVAVGLLAVAALAPRGDDTGAKGGPDAVPGIAPTTPAAPMAPAPAPAPAAAPPPVAPEPTPEADAGVVAEDPPEEAPKKKKRKKKRKKKSKRSTKKKPSVDIPRL